MLIAFDIGNTNIVVGVFQGEDLQFVLRLKTDHERTVDEYAALLFSLLDKKLPTGATFNQAIVSSVVPPITPDITRLIQDSFSLRTLLVGPGIKTGLPIRTVDPAAVGADRVVNAVAAKTLYGAPALVIDFGTATSFDVVSSEGAYEGGIIAPGVRISLEALVKNTAKLPRIELSWPETVVGKNTIRAMQSGAVIGYACLVDGLVAKLEEEVGKFEHVIATGGLGQLFAQHSSVIHRYEPHLTLRGLRVLASMNS